MWKEHKLTFKNGRTKEPVKRYAIEYLADQTLSSIGKEWIRYGERKKLGKSIGKIRKKSTIKYVTFGLKKNNQRTIWIREKYEVKKRKSLISKRLIGKRKEIASENKLKVGEAWKRRAVELSHKRKAKLENGIKFFESA